MKVIIKYCLISVLLSFTLCFVSSCDFRSKYERIDDKVQVFLNYLDNKDKDVIKSMFAPAKINSIVSFDDDLEELLNYYDGVSQTKIQDSIAEDIDKHYEFSAKWYNIPYIIKTTKEEYRFAFYWCEEYTTDKDFLGIWSFYIIKENLFNRPTDYAYRGDGLWTPGINIDKVYD